MKVLTIVGARPQFVKAAVVSAALQRTGLREVLVHTGQHSDEQMSAVFFRELGMRAPDHILGVSGGTHGEQTGRMLEAAEAVLRTEAPDWVLVYGDTNSTLAGALAAAKLNLPIAHVEAGLRSFNRAMPEEVNRVLTDHLSVRLFAPTCGAVANLASEGITGARVALVGDVMLDATRAATARALETSDLARRLGLRRDGYVLATVHRQENVDRPERLRGILEGLACVSDRTPVVLPVHPRTRRMVERWPDGEALLARLHALPPLGYLDMMALEHEARLVVTDSGGVQKEAFFHGVPCITLREETEWTELVDAGWNVLVPPTDADVVAQAIVERLDWRPPREAAAAAEALYGGGQASARIAAALA